MASARPPGGGGGSTPQARIGIDLSSFQSAPAIAREAGRATAREISNAFRTLQAEQKLAQTQAQQTLAVLRAQQSQITATTRAESSVRISAARAESIAQQQAARAAAVTTIEEQKRLTAQYKSELRERERANRQSQVSAGAFGRGAATFAGAALGGPIGGLAGAVAGGALPLAAGLVVSQGARFALETSQIAVAYNRQSVAAVNLAGSQAKLNSLLAAYGRASGGAVDKATALANVTRLMAVGFADNAEEVDRFTRAVRGSSIAMGKLQEDISQEVQLAISNQSLRRLDQIGLGISEVNARIEELRSNNQGMTREAAFQEAVLGLLNEKFGALADSAEGQATGIERLTAAWKDFRLEVGQEIKPDVDQATNDLADLYEWLVKIRNVNAEFTSQALLSRQQQEGSAVGLPSLTPSAANRSGNTPFTPRIAPAFDPDRTAALRRRNEGFASIERESALARLDATRSYERQRTNTITQYEKGIAREAEDFGRQRANAERKLQMSILDVAQDSARQRVKWEEELARNIAKAQADSAERVAETREDSAKRLVDLEEDYAKDREKRQRAHSKTLREAAANLDAVAVREEQLRFREEAKEAKEAHDEQKQDIGKQLAERLDDEAKSLAKSIRQQQEANQRRVEEQAENDALRIEEMRANFEAQKVEEDAQRAISLARRAEDHATQLAEMATAQAERIQQIKDHAEEERIQFTEESNKFLEEVGIHNQAWLDEQERINDGVIKLHTELLEQQRRALLTPGHPSLADPYVDRAMISGSSIPPVMTPGMGSIQGSTRSLSVGDITVNVLGSTNMNRNELYDIVYGAIADVMEDAS